MGSNIRARTGRVVGKKTSRTKCFGDRLKRALAPDIVLVLVDLEEGASMGPRGAKDALSRKCDGGTRLASCL